MNRSPGLIVSVFGAGIAVLGLMGNLVKSGNFASKIKTNSYKYLHTIVVIEDTIRAYIYKHGKGPDSHPIEVEARHSCKNNRLWLWASSQNKTLYKNRERLMFPKPITAYIGSKHT